MTIIGSQFDSGASVTFDGTPATSVNVIAGSVLTAVTPALSAGAVDVTVTNSDGQSSTLPQAFTVLPPPPPPPPPSADLVDTLDAPTGVQTPGSDVVLQVHLGNLGPDSTAVVFTVTLADGLTFTASPFGCPVSGQTASCTGFFASGADFGNQPFTVHLPDTATGDYTITSSLTGDLPDPNTANNTASTQLHAPPPPSADLVDTLDAPTGVQTPGSDVVLQVHLGNLGPDSTAVVFTVTLADGLTFTASPFGCPVSGQTASCTGFFASGADFGNQPFTVHLPDTATGDYTITSSLTGDLPDPNTANNTASTQLHAPPPPSADLVDTLDAPTGVQTPGSDVVLQVHLGNLGPDSTAVVFTVTLADGLTFTASPFGCPVSGQTASCTGFFASGADFGNQPFTVHLPDTATGDYTITSSLTGDLPDPNTANNTASTQLTHRRLRRLIWSTRSTRQRGCRHREATWCCRCISATSAPTRPRSCLPSPSPTG